MPHISFAPPATEAERAQFATAIPDSKNRGVFDKHGNRISPRHNHHVDNNMYGDISELMNRAAAASIIRMYKILGYPDGRYPDPISWGKFGSAYSHKRRRVGWEFNARTLTYTLPPDKRIVLQQMLEEWIKKDNCSILEAATLHGTLADASRANRQGRTLFSASKMLSAEQSSNDSTKSEDASAAKAKQKSIKQNFRNTSTIASIP